MSDERKNCPDCKLIESKPGILAPRHDPSPACESGKHPHCSCDVCF